MNVELNYRVNKSMNGKRQMRSVLITGRNGYIGNSLEDYFNQQKGDIKVSRISMRDDEWFNHDFSQYDTIIHVAGMVHMKESIKRAADYHNVNYVNTIVLAKKAKQQGVRHFIFLSSTSVYGINTGVINEHTVPKPTSLYGQSKYAAELALDGMAAEDFCISILRLPMVYGKECSGNYARLAMLAKITWLFPDIQNQRSMIHITNLCELLYQMLQREMTGVYFPQNKEYIETTGMVREIAKIHNHPIWFTKLFNSMLMRMMNKVMTVNKLFGSLVYEHELSRIEDIHYQIVDFERSIELSE